MRLYVIVEGGTELEFVKRTLVPHLDLLQIWTTPIEVGTKHDRRTRAKIGRGGGHWKHWRKEIENIMKSQQKSADFRCTTLFDLYGLPDDFPSIEQHGSESNTAKRAELLEKAMAAEIGDYRFIPYLQLHEFETLVLAALHKLEEILENRSDLDGLAELRASIGNLKPEEINDGKDTAPSKRLLTFIPSYQKKTHGSLVTEAAGLGLLRQVCPRFGVWVTTLEKL